MRLNLLKFKKFFLVILTTSFLMSLNIVPANAVADGPVNCGTRGTFTVASNVVTGNTSCVGSVNIPSGVTRIGTNAFQSNWDITSVVIPDTVLAIDDGAFWGADEITSVTIGNGVTTIGVRAFNGTSKITSLNIPNSVTTIGNGAFGDLFRLTSLTLGNQLRTIGGFAFDNSGVTSLIIPDSVTTIGTSSFRSAPLTSLTLGNQLITIGEFAFHGNSSLTSVTIPNSVTSIGANAFELNTALASVTIGNSVESIGSGAFSLTALASVTIPASVTSIGNSAFESNSLLTSVTFLGIAAPTVGVFAFTDGCDCATANVLYNATGFGAEGSTWNNLRITYGSAPAEESGSNSAPIITPTATKTPDAIFNLKNKKYLSKNEMKTKLRKNKSFIRNPKDLYKYSIFKASDKTCSIQENYVTSLKKTGTCDLYATRTTTKGAKYKYWVQINYTK